jgi:hypothetical protein
MTNFVGAHDLAPLFAGLSFDLSKMRVIMPGSQALNKAQFDIAFGGYTFALDHRNERTTRSAWKAFTANEAFRPPIIYK